MNNTLYYAMRLCYRKSNFPTEKLAKKKAGEIIRIGGVHLYPYGCSNCGNWHLTKNPSARGKVL